MLFTDEKPNLSRQYEFDLAKAFTIIGMIIIHVYESLSVVDFSISASCLFDIILESTQPTGAPLFMIAMGVGIVYSTHRSPSELAKRGIKLLALGYILNLLRSSLLDCIIMLIKGKFNFEYLSYYLFNIDIMQFAGLSFMLTALLKKIKVPVLAMGAIAVIMQIIGQFLSKIEINSLAVQYIFGLFFYTSDCACFPLLLWYIYPVAGIIIAKYLRHLNNLDKFYRDVFAISVTVLAGLCFALYLTGYDISRFFLLYGDSFYKQDFLSFIYTMCIVMSELSIFHYIIKVVHISWLSKFIHYLSSNLNTIYILQWIIIGNLAIIFYWFVNNYLERIWIIPVAMIILACSIIFSYIWTHIRKNNHQ